MNDLNLEGGFCNLEGGFDNLEGTWRVLGGHLSGWSKSLKSCDWQGVRRIFSPTRW